MDNIEDLIKQAKRTLDHIGVRPVIPRDPSRWRDFVVNLRKNILNFRQAEFWEMFDLNRSSGYRYEQGGTKKSARPILRKTMLHIADVLDLDWEIPKEHLRGVDSNTNPDAKEVKERMLQLLLTYDVSEPELECLLKFLYEIRQINSQLEKVAKD